MNMKKLTENYWWYKGLLITKINNLHCRLHVKSWHKMYDFYSYHIEVCLSKWEEI